MTDNEERKNDGMEGYDFGIDDDFQAGGVEYAANVRVELIELVNEFTRAYVPQYAVTEQQIVCRAERGQVSRVVVGEARIVKLTY